MKVKLVVSNEHYEEIKGFLLNHGIEIDDDADLVLSENNRFPDNIVVKDAITNCDWFTVIVDGQTIAKPYIPGGR